MIFFPPNPFQCTGKTKRMLEECIFSQLHTVIIEGSFFLIKFSTQNTILYMAFIKILFFVL